MEQFIAELKYETKCEVLSDHISRRLYATDASMYEIEPLAVIIPRSKHDLTQALEITSRYQVPVIARGAATNVTGACLGKAVVIDCAKYLNHILEINYTEHYAIVQPGVVLDQLTEAIRPHGLTLGIDTSTKNRATIGGMIATNASGAYSLKHANLSSHILEIELVLHDGAIIRLGPQSKLEHKHALSEKSPVARLYRALERIKKAHAEDIKEHFPKISRRSSGYNLDTLLADNYNAAALICGSEGTLGIISEIKIALLPKKAFGTLTLLGFDSMTSLQYVPKLLELKPDAIELVDDKIITAAKTHPTMQGRLDWLENKNPAALFIVEFEANDLESCIRQAKQAEELLQGSDTLSFCQTITDPKIQDNVWQMRNSGLGLLLSRRSYSRGVAFVEDATVPVAVLAPFVARFKAILDNHHKEAGFFGHVGAGCIHVRPYFDCRDPEELKRMQCVMHEVQQLVFEFQGVLSGEHGDGLVRSWTNATMFHPTLIQAFIELKLAFDPYNLMNPGKIVALDEQPLSKLTEHLRLNPETTTRELAPYFDFSKEGGLSLSVDMCNGNGQCRKKEGIMCPSFQVTHDEKDSTRARANLLRDFVHGKLSEKELFEEGFSSVLDLCIMCKGCKTECPSQVDMAKLKSEFLYMHRLKHRSRLRDWLLGHISSLLSCFTFGGPSISWLARKIAANSLCKKLLHYIGIASERNLPLPAPRPFSSLYTPSEKKGLKEVVLFIDTFTEFLHPSIGLSAIQVLKALDFDVNVPQWNCCGRTLISKGFLPEAKVKLQRLIDCLYEYAKKDIPIVGLEPSCLLTLVDEAKALHLDMQKVSTVANMSQLLVTFLAEHADTLAKKASLFQADVLIHGHCHQKALVGMHAELALIRRFVSGAVSEIPSGCCGMAGSFGYETEHAAFSKKIGELVLFPHIRHAKKGTLIITSGTSCRAQIEDVLGIKALHPIEFIAERLQTS